MTNTLTFQSGATVTPLLIDGWRQRRTGGAKGHPLIDGGVDYTHTPRLYRTGTLSLVFDVEADVVALDDLVAAEPYFDLVSDEAILANGRFVPVGDIPIVQHDSVRSVWLVSFDASEDV